ncbi:MAG: ABC transporter permease, partial [Ilumatobacteraceae bacterium]
MRFARTVAAPLVGLVTFGLLWEAAVRIFDIRRFVLLAPSAIISEFLDAPAFYLENALVTARHMAIGLSISLLVAIAVGAVMASNRFIEEAVQPILVLILVTPWVAYITSVVVWLSFGERPILFMVAFATFPVFTFGVVGGMKSADPAARELLASVSANRWEVFWRLRLPSALLSIFTTARFAIALGLAAAYFSEGQALAITG